MTDEADALLSVANIEVVYNQVLTAIKGVSLTIPQGAIVAMIGTNGAGKSTTLRAISGFIGLDDARVTEGTIRFKGREIQNQSPHAITAQGIVVVPEREKIFESLTVAENMDFNVFHGQAGISRDHMIELVYKYFPGLKRLRNRQAGYLSGGERQMLALASALLCGPELLLVDELSLGLAPLIIEELMENLLAIREEIGLTILLVEQNANAALKIADYGYVIENGRIVLDGDSERLRNHQDIKDFYLGLGEKEGRKSYRDVKQYRRSRRWYG